jgi:hypothetical protein
MFLSTLALNRLSALSWVTGETSGMHASSHHTSAPKKKNPTDVEAIETVESFLTFQPILIVGHWLPSSTPSPLSCHLLRYKDFSKSSPITPGFCWGVHIYKPCYVTSLKKNNVVCAVPLRHEAYLTKNVINRHHVKQMKLETERHQMKRQLKTENVKLS